MAYEDRERTYFGNLAIGTVGMLVSLGTGNVVGVVASWWQLSNAHTVFTEEDEKRLK